MRFAKISLSVLCLTVLMTMALVSPATAQQSEQRNMVAVDLRDVKDQIATSMNIDASRIPSSVWAPLSTAAQVCGVSSDTLASQRQSGQASCRATSTSQELNQFIYQQLTK